MKGNHPRLLMTCLLVAASSACSTRPAQSEAVDDLYVRSLLSSSTARNAPLAQLSTYLNLSQKERVKVESFTLTTSYSFPPLEPGSLVEKAIISLRPDSEDSIAHARFLLTDVGDARCIKARTFAVEHGLLPAPSVHPKQTIPPQPWVLPCLLQP